MKKLTLALAACYHWSLYHPEAVAYGLFLFGLSQFRVGDGLLILIGASAIAGGLRGIVYPPKEEPR